MTKAIAASAPPATAGHKPLLRRLAAVLLAAFAAPARASIFVGEALDTMADVLTWIVLVIVPLAVIALFWMVHILPEKIAEKRHHPQKDAIKTLCLLSLAFGGMLWPLAWLWAYIKPVGYKLAYGTDKGDDFYTEMGEQARAGKLAAHEAAHALEELAAMASRGKLPLRLEEARRNLEAAASRAAPGAAAAAAPADRKEGKA